MNCKVDLKLYILFSMFLSMVFFANNGSPQNLPESATISEKSISVTGGLGRLQFATKRFQMRAIRDFLVTFRLIGKILRKNVVFKSDLNFKQGPR